jgi:hypothetical protein
MFRSNTVPPPSGSKNSPCKKPEAGGKLSLIFDPENGDTVLTCPQEPATGPYPEPDESSLDPLQQNPSIYS